MKVIPKKILGVVLSASMVFSAAPVCFGSAAVYAASPVTLAESVPSGLQADCTFPDWAGYVDDTLLMNNRYSFKAYKGQGVLYIKCTDLSSTRFFVNGKQIDISAACKNSGKTYKVDISAYTVNGSNTLQINDYAPATGKIEVKIPYPEVIAGTAQSVGMDTDELNLIDTIISNDVKYGFTSAQLAIIKNGVLVKNTAYGTVNAYNQNGTRKTDSAKVTTDTLYDLASNTKMYATNYAMQKLVSEGKVSINDKVTKYFPEFQDGANDAIKGKADLTLKEIMEHQAGFPADPQYFNDHFDQAAQKSDPNVDNILYSQDKKTTIQRIMNTPLIYQPGTQTKYSDVDYMLLGLIVEKVTGQNLDQYVENTIYKPMGLTHIMYNPLQKGFGVQNCAATELNGNTRDGAVSFKNVRTNTLQGQVHDEKAYYCMNGVSGHAGLFADAGDLAKLCQVMLNGGGYGGNKFFDKNTIAEFTKRKDALPTWGLGWWREGSYGRPWYFGVESSDDTIGHQGWTGTLTMIDPKNDLVMVLLTNKINSPLIDNKSNANDFVGNKFTTATLGTIPDLIYQSINHASETAVNANVSEMVSEKMKLYRAHADKYDGKTILQAAYSLVDTAVTRAEQKKTTETRDYAKKAISQLDTSIADASVVAEFQKRLGAVKTYSSDTTSNITVKGSYTFKITSKNGKAPVFTLGTSNVFKYSLVKKSGSDYYFKITVTAKKGTRAGIYVNGEGRLLIATVG